VGQFFLRNAKPTAQLANPRAERDPEIVHREMVGSRRRVAPYSISIIRPISIRDGTG